jgi:hypothetical protein
VVGHLGKIDEHKYHLQQSLVQRFDVHRIPLKLEPHPEMEYDELKKVMEVCDGLQTFYPECIKEDNIASNAGLIRMVKQLWTELRDHEVPSIKIILCDINIFTRLVKVSFLSKTNAKHVIL